MTYKIYLGKFKAKQEQVKMIEEKSRLTIRDRIIKEQYINEMNNIKEQIYNLDKDDGENTSVKDFKIRSVIDELIIKRR